jgi:transcriptional regulator with GAF, ATPase, and Fis domain
MKAHTPKSSDFEDEQLFPGSEINSDHECKDIAGKSSALQSVREQVAIVAPTNATCCCTGKRERGGNWLHVPSTNSADCLGMKRTTLQTKI